MELGGTPLPHPVSHAPRRGHLNHWRNHKQGQGSLLAERYQALQDWQGKILQSGSKWHYTALTCIIPDQFNHINHTTSTSFMTQGSRPPKKCPNQPLIYWASLLVRSGAWRQASFFQELCHSHQGEGNLIISNATIMSLELTSKTKTTCFLWLECTTRPEKYQKSSSSSSTSISNRANGRWMCPSSLFARLDNEAVTTANGDGKRPRIRTRIAAQSNIQFVQILGLLIETSANAPARKHCNISDQENHFNHCNHQDTKGAPWLGSWKERWKPQPPPGVEPSK